MNEAAACHPPWFWHCMGAKRWDPFGKGHRHRHGHRHGHPHPPGPPPWFQHMFGGPAPLAERGEVRYLILDAIKDEPRHGYDIIQTIESRSSGRYRPSPGTVYPTLQMLEELGQVRTKELDDRKAYEITEEGLAELDEHKDDVEDAYERFGGTFDWDDMPDFHHLFKHVHKLLRALGSGCRRGSISHRKMKRIHQVIDDAIDQIDDIIRDKKA